MKKDSKGLPVRSSVSWRQQEKGKEGAVSQGLSSQPNEEKLYRLAGYIRLSPSNEEREEGSLVSHPQRITQFVELKNAQHGKNWGEIVEWYVDRDLSGKDLNRPAFQRMCRDIGSGKVNAVIVTEISRLSRNVKDFCQFRESLKAQGATFFSLKENFDTSTPAGELMVIQCIGFAQFERQTIVERIQRGARARAERGLANGVLLLGFNRVEGKPNHRAVNEQEKPYVEMLFRKFLELRNIENLIRFLDENGYRTKDYVTKEGEKRGGGRWTHSSLYNILTNRAYIGQREVNKRNRGVEPASVKEGERYFYVDAQWPAIIPKKLFDDVQDLLSENKKKARKYTHNFLLTGLLKCGLCGKNLTGKSGHSKAGKYYYYGHLRKRTSFDNRHLERCKLENIPAVEMEERILGELGRMAKDRELVKKLVIATQEGGVETLRHKESLVNSKEQERRKVGGQIDNLIMTLSEAPGEISKKMLLQKVEELTAAKDSLESELVALREDLSRSKDNVVDSTSAFSLLRAFRQEFRSLPLGEQGNVLRDIIRQIVVKPEETALELYGAASSGDLTLGELAESDSVGPGIATSRSSVRSVFKLVDRMGIEPTTSALRTRRSPS